MIELDYKWCIKDHDLYYEDELICLHNYDIHDDNPELFERVEYLNQEWPDGLLLPNGTFERCMFLNELVIPEDIEAKYNIYLRTKA